jgi:hypothetical protein
VASFDTRFAKALLRVGGDGDGDGGGGYDVGRGGQELNHASH